MKTKFAVEKIQSVFDWLEENLSPLENRWWIFIITSIVMVLAQAAGASGLTLLIGLFYIMYFITLRS